MLRVAPGGSATEPSASQLPALLRQMSTLLADHTAHSHGLQMAHGGASSEAAAAAAAGAGAGAALPPRWDVTALMAANPAAVLSQLTEVRLSEAK